MELDAIEAIERAAKALDAASEAVGSGLGERPQLAEMLALWLMEEAQRLRDALPSVGVNNCPITGTVNGIKMESGYRSKDIEQY